MILETLFSIVIWAAMIDQGSNRCDCPDQVDVKRARKSADLVVVAKAIDSERLQVFYPGTLTHFPQYVMEYTFLVERRIKDKQHWETQNDKTPL